MQEFMRGQRWTIANMVWDGDKPEASEGEVSIPDTSLLMH